jgi:hypothetical protein
MGNLRQSMTEDEWNEMGKVPSTKNSGVTYYGGAIPYHHIEKVDHPLHYGGQDNPYEAIKVIEAWGLGFNLGNVVKYIARSGKKEGCDITDELEKSKWYICRELELLKKANES